MDQGRGRTGRRLAAALALGVAAGGPAAADEIHLVGGGVVQVDAWRDVGDAIEFTRGGGIVRIGKSEIARIVGDTTRSDLRMYSAPAAPAALPADPRAAVREMADVLREGEGLFGQAGLTAEQKIAALRRLGERWQAVAPPEPLKETHARGLRALQVGVDADTAEVEGTAPDARERVDQARAGIREALAEVRKAAGEQG
jgi:hypothetical protein